MLVIRILFAMPLRLTIFIAVRIFTRHIYVVKALYEEKQGFPIFQLSCF